MNKANSNNTVFLTVAAFHDYEKKTRVFRESAKKHNVPVVFCDLGVSWHGFFTHKVLNMKKRLEILKQSGTKYVFVLDCRDVVFIEDIQIIFDKFNSINNGKAIFNLDHNSKIWPSHSDWMLKEMQNAIKNEYAFLNAGMIASHIDTLLTIQAHIINIRDELNSGLPRRGVASRFHNEYGNLHLNDDQNLYQICMTYYPELFQIDIERNLFTILLHYPASVNEVSNDYSRYDSIGNAAIIHSPWLARHSLWLDWYRLNKWDRNNNTNTVNQ